MKTNRSAHPARRVLIGRIETLGIGRDDATLGFEGRLAAENGWTRSFAGRVATEYRRFLALIANSEEPLTPSDAVDQAWHLHMVYTRDYWHGLCRDTVRRELHHEPTSGGVDQRDYYRERYAHTLDRYRTTFGTEPPGDIWPDPSQRFAGQFERVDRATTMLLGAEAAIGLGIAAAGLVVLIAQGMAVFAAVLLVVVVIGAFLLGAALRTGSARRQFLWSFDGGDGIGSDGCGGWDGGCGGGCGGCG